MTSGRIKKLTDSNFDQEIEKTPGLFIVDFWAEWCAPCKMIAPILEDIAEEYNTRITIGKLNVDENHDTPSKYGIRSIPTLIFFKEGKKVEEVIGALPKATLKAKIDRWL